MSVIRSIPGRVRFFAQSIAAIELLHTQLQENATAWTLPIQLSYNPCTKRGLLLFSKDTEATEALIDFINAQETVLTHTYDTVENKKRGSKILTYEIGASANDALENPFMLVGKRVTRFYLTRLFMPMILRPYWTVFSVAPLLIAGARSLMQKKLDVQVLDAAAISASLLMRDFRTAGTIHLLLDISEMLEDWTKEKSKSNLSALFAGEKKPVWVMRKDEPISIDADELVHGDLVIVDAGGRIPVDGTVADGLAMVNEASMTGEALAVKKMPGSEVYAGTALEEGRLIIVSEAIGNDTRFGKIAKILLDSEDMKANIQNKATAMADKIVPFSFLASGIVFLFTRNMAKAATVLLADYSCAIKLATPLAVRSAMLESAKEGALIKGGKFLEALAELDAVVLDKTGTLTESRPELTKICPLNGYTEDFVLRQAACMEEHFPHPIAEAIVKKAHERGLKHSEDHATVEYILAHGIVTTLHGERMTLGSKHFVYDDEGIPFTEEANKAIEACSQSGVSLLYLACAGKLAGVLAVKDPIRKDAHSFIRQLEALKMKRIIMLTGDSEGTAMAVADELGIDEYYAQVLPDEKMDLIKKLQEEGHIVAMIGDGINDSAALRYADVGISLKHGAAIAKETCDVVLTGEHLESFIDTVKIAKGAMQRVRRNFMSILVSNTLFIGLGLAGIISPALMALLHNSGTVFICAMSMRPILGKNNDA